MTAYIIDDHSDTAEIMAYMLTMEGYKTKHFQKFEPALQNIKTDNPCLIFCDYNVPDSMTPEEFIKEVRKDFPALPIILISGYYHVVKNAKALGATFGILKPMEPSAIIAVTRQHCVKNGPTD